MSAAEAVAVPLPLADNDRLHVVFGMGQVGRVLAVTHTGGILATLASLWGGGTHVIMARFDPDLAVDLIEREAVTGTLLVPTMLAAAAGAQLARPRNVSSLRYLSHGASPISAETLRRTRQAFPAAGLLHVYGTTETTPITTLLPHEERILDTPLVRSCGQPAMGVEIRVVNSSQTELPPDENIYSTEVEDALAAHPAVAEAAVFGVPDPRWREAVYAVVFSLRDVTAGELAAHCRDRIAGLKVPRCIELRTEPLPKSAAGKILKRDLREPHWAGQHTQISGG